MCYCTAPGIRAGENPAKKTEKGDEQIMDSLDNASTKDLVEELKRREGVEATIAEPYEDVEIKVNGPAIVLVVTD